MLEINKRSNGKAEEFSLSWGAEADREMVLRTGSPRQHTWRLGVFSQAVVLSTSGLSRVYMPILMKLTKIKHKEQILKTARKKTTNNTQEDSHKDNSWSFNRNSSGQEGMAGHT